MATKLGSLIARALFSKQRRRFVDDDSGVTMIEFGLLAPIFFSIIGAILETSIIMMSGQVLDSAVQDASRAIRTGQARSTILNVADFKQSICNHLFGLFRDCDALHVEVQVVANFAGVSITAPIDPVCKTACGWTRIESYTPGQGSNIMIVQVYYKWPVLLNLFDFNMSNLPGNQRLLGAATVFRNEPFT